MDSALLAEAPRNKASGMREGGHRSPQAFLTFRYNTAPPPSATEATSPTKREVKNDVIFSPKYPRSPTARCPRRVQTVGAKTKKKKREEEKENKKEEEEEEN